MASAKKGAHNCSSCSTTTRRRTPTQATQGSHSVSHSASAQHQSYAQPSGTPNIVYIVTDTCYPKKSDLANNKGMTAVFSVHSTMEAANSRAKKIIYENDGGCTVDIDKVIEETRRGLYTGIGIGGDEEKPNGCYARKCEVESKILDEDSEDESGESNEYGTTDEDDKDGDVEMG